MLERKEALSTIFSRLERKEALFKKKRCRSALTKNVQQSMDLGLYGTLDTVRGMGEMEEMKEEREDMKEKMGAEDRKGTVWHTGY